MKRKLLSFMMLFAVSCCFVGGCKKEKTDEKAIKIADGKEVVATINGVNYTADQVYGDFINLNSSAEYIYEQLEDLLIKTAVPVTDSMRSRIENEVEKWKKDIKENATISGKAYKEQLNEALKSEGVSSVEELIENKIFALQEEILTNRYWNESKNDYYESYLTNRYVYHISQIVVNVTNNNNSDYFGVELTSAQAEKLYNVVSMLLSGESFDNVAMLHSDDSASKAKGGDLGMVTLNDTTISDEVKYALAAYSVYLENAQLNTPDYMDNVYKNGIETISQEYVDLFGEVYNDTSTQYLSTSSGNTLYARVYGKNVIFNNLFNTRTFRFLQSDGNVNVVSMDNIKMPLKDEAGFAAKSTQNILTNDKGTPILVVRSNSSVHFISIEKSAFVDKEELLKYYSKEINELDGYKTYLETMIDNAIDVSSNTVKEETIAVLDNLANDYAIMKVSGNDNLSGNKDFIRYDMFNKYLNGTYSGIKFEITNEEIASIISQYIAAKKEYVQTKIDNAYGEGYEKQANIAEFVDMSIIKKEIPLLRCLEKGTDNKYMCTYTYKDGFVSTGGGQ